MPGDRILWSLTSEKSQWISIWKIHVDIILILRECGMKCTLKQQFVIFSNLPVLVICCNFLLAGIDAFIFHREIKYDIILHCHIFYPVAEYVTLFEYTCCLLFYSSLSIWFTSLFIYYLLICLSGRGLTLSTNGDLSVRDC